MNFGFGFSASLPDCSVHLGKNLGIYGLAYLAENTADTVAAITAIPIQIPVLAAPTTVRMPFVCNCVL